MGRPEWDEVDEAPNAVSPPAAAPVVTRPARRLLPWLVALLASSACAAAVARHLAERTVEREALALARDEAAELRRALFATQERFSTVDKERSRQASTAAKLEEALATHGAEREANDQLIAKLRAELDEREGDVVGEGKRISVSVVDELLFPSGEAELSGRGKELLGRLGAVLKNLRDQQILVGGHTDDRPIHTTRFASNWELSAARAVNVTRHLVEVVGVDQEEPAHRDPAHPHRRSETPVAAS
jgi:chemotaxis protein MotB